MKRPWFIGVTGGSCSGKTMFAERLSLRLGDRPGVGAGVDAGVGAGVSAGVGAGVGAGEVVGEVVGGRGCPVISIDSYYLGLPGATHEEIERYNFDDPAALDREMLAGHLSLLASGHAADIPVYDFSTHTRAGQVRRVEPAAFIIVEGLFSLYWDDVRALLDTKVFIDVPHEECLARRIERDTRERGRSRAEIVRRYDTMAWPTYDKYVLPSRAYADVVIDGTRPVDESVGTVWCVVDETAR